MEPIIKNRAEATRDQAAAVRARESPWNVRGHAGRQDKVCLRLFGFLNIQEMGHF